MRRLAFALVVVLMAACSSVAPEAATQSTVPLAVSPSASYLQVSSCSLDALAAASGLSFNQTTQPSPGIRQTVEQQVAQSYSAARIVDLFEAVGANESAPILDRPFVAVVLALADTPSALPGASLADAGGICAIAFYDASTGNWLTTFGGDGLDQLAGKLPFEYDIANIDGPPVTVSIDGVVVGAPVVCEAAAVVLTANSAGMPPLPWHIVVSTLDGSRFGSGSADGSLAKVLFVRREGVMEEAQPGNPGPGPQLPCPTGPPPTTIPPSSTALIASEPPSPAQEQTSSPVPVPTGYLITIATGIQPKWTASQAAALVMGYVLRMRQIAQPDAPDWALVLPRVLSVSAMKLINVPEDAYGGTWKSNSGHQDPNEVIWVVEAQGTFDEPAPGRTLWANHGYWVFDDQGNQIESSFTPVLASTTPR